MHYPGNFPGMIGMYPSIRYRDYLVYLLEQNNYMLYETKIKIDEIHAMMTKDTPCAQAITNTEEQDYLPASISMLPKEISRGAEEIRIEKDLFAPAVVTVRQGTSVVWKNESQEEVTLRTEDDSFESATLKPGQTYSAILRPGTYRYTSTSNPLMRGTLQVL